MTRRRFYAPPSAFDAKRASVTLASDEARHLREVLRLKVGDDVSVFNGAGQEFKCRIADSRRDTAELEVVSEISPAKPESPLRLTLAVALLKGEKFDLVVRQHQISAAEAVAPGRAVRTFARCLGRGKARGPMAANCAGGVETIGTRSGS